jgi:hypothetical protein
VTNLVSGDAPDPARSTSETADDYPLAPTLPTVFSPQAAAEMLRGIGLTEITTCALRTRAYRRQVPFHLNGRRIVFTLSDLREIAEGGARPPASAHIDTSSSTHPGTHGDPVHPRADVHLTGWRARRLHQPETEPQHPTSPAHGQHARRGATRSSHGA